MADQIRTKCGQKLMKKKLAQKPDCITIGTNSSYKFYILSNLIIRGYLEQFFDGVSFRGCAEKKNILKVLYSLLNDGG